MNENQHDLLLDAVDALTKPRMIHTTIIDDDTGEWLRVHTEEHPPLLILLMEGTGITRMSPNSNISLPIDADALELWGQVHDMVKLWCRQLDASFISDDLLMSIRHWYMAHVNVYRGNKISEVTDRDITRMVQGWVRMIETKFDPEEKREWTEPCPAFTETRNIDGDVIGNHRCNARRIVVAGEERFAIQLNVTTMTAECGRCHSKWVGERGVLDLRKATELHKLIREEDEAQRTAEMERLAAGDTPEIVVDETSAM